MASKAIHLKRGFKNAFITVDELFEAAFGRKPGRYRTESLLGWRPLVPDSVPSAFRLQEKAAGHGKRPSVTPPDVKVYETEELIVVEVELPAIEKESLYLEISGDLLIIRGNRVPDEQRRHIKPSQKTGRAVYRYVQLPVVVKPGEVRARLDGHVVRVTINKHVGLEYEG